MRKNKTFFWRGFIFFIALFFSNFSFAGLPLRPSALSVDFMRHAEQVFQNGYPVNTPLDQALSEGQGFHFVHIARKQPFFGWEVPQRQDNTLQTAYRILVALSRDSLQKGMGDCWDSGKVLSGQSVNVVYQGTPLLPGKIYYWKVKTWDNHQNESDYSAVAGFVTADSLRAYATERYPLQKQDQLPDLVHQLDRNTYFFDYGKDAFGSLRLTIDGGQGGDTLLIHMGEKLKNGRIDRHPGGTVRYSSYRLILGGGIQTYSIALAPDHRNTGPRAIHLPKWIGNVMPFRYVELEGVPDQMSDCQLVREMIHYPFNDHDSYFHSSDSVLNEVWDLCKYTVKATSFAGVFVDGDRERIPYEADALIDQLGWYNVVADYTIPRYTYEYLIHHATWPTEWILQTVVMAWNDYLYTGNKVSLEQFYSDLQAKTLVKLADDDGFISTKTGKVTPGLLRSIYLKGKLTDIVDWPHSGILGLGKKEGGETDGFVFEKVNTVVNAWHYATLRMMATIAKELGKNADQQFYRNQADLLEKNFNHQLVDSERKIYTDGIGTSHASLHGNMFPLAFGLVPERLIPSVNRFIESRGMACSVYGAQFLLDAVYNGDNAGYGLKLLTSKAERSWYNMIRAGATMTMEAWDDRYKPNQDWNHAWGAAPANIIPRRLMGIEPLQAGFREIQIKPQPASLRQAKMILPTIRGDIVVAFENEPGKSFKLDVEIPANSQANVYLPCRDSRARLWVDGSFVRARSDGHFLKISDVGSGKHHFMVYEK